MYLQKHSHDTLGRPAYLLPLLSGIALIPAFPPANQGYLAWIALVPFFWFCLQARPGQALLGGYLFGIPLHSYLNLYLAGVLFTHLSHSLAILALVLLILALASFNALFALAASCMRRLQNSFATALAIPALWLLMEYCRSLSFIGYNVGYIGYTQWNYPFALNIASVYGYWGIAFFIALWQSLIVPAWTRSLRGKKLIATAAIFIVPMALGILVPPLYPVKKSNETLFTALIQGNSSAAEILSQKGKQVILQRYLDYTRQALEREPQVELVVWPETVVDLHFDEEMMHHPQMMKIAEELGIAILYGARVKDVTGLYNAILLLNPDGTDQIYRKQRLVPFAEYFPMADLLNRLVNLDFILGSYTPGEETNLFRYNGIPLAGVICFESYFGDYTRLFARKGARHLFILTNDVWFGKTNGPEQHAQVAAIRAAETGMGVTQVANSGITISFDYQGKELVRSEKMEAEIIILPLDLASRDTFYVKAGEFLPAACLVYLALTAGSALLRQRRAGTTGGR